MSDQFGVGMVAIVAGPTGPTATIVETVKRVAGALLEPCNGVWLATWGLGGRQPGPDEPLLLTKTTWGEQGPVPGAKIARWLADDDLLPLSRMLPPFGALGLTASGLRLAFDRLAFCPAYVASAEGWSAVSTSPLLLGQMLGGGLDTESLLLQSQLGWQLGTHTVFEGVRALAPLESVSLDPGGLRVDRVPDEAPIPGTITLDEGVTRASDCLRHMLDLYLDATEAPTLQLTGGQDSRLVLSAISPERRADVQAMTLDTPGGEDARIAARISDRYGMRHTVRGLGRPEERSPEEWFTRVTAVSRAQGCMTDPVARAVTALAEESFAQGPRLSGLGGELARGFYYAGAAASHPVTRGRVERLARWRMLINDAVTPAALAAEHRDAAWGTAVDIVYEEMSGADGWFAAADALYAQRIQRWGGPGETSASALRALTNPLLSHRFVAVASALPPRAKLRSRFLGALQVELDGDLADLPLDGRPAPRSYAAPSLANVARVARATARKASHKATQRLRGSRRPPPGGRVVATRLAEHLRRDPGPLTTLRETGVFDQRYLDRISSGEEQPSPSTVALLVNVLVATDPEVGR